MPRLVWRQFSITPIWNGEPVHGSVTVFAQRIKVDNSKANNVDIVLYAGKQPVSMLRLADHRVREWLDGHLVTPRELEVAGYGA